MSIAEKLTQVAENIPKVYKAGQSSMVDESKLIPKTVSGNYISVDDVSEIPHKVGCKVESVNLWSGNNGYSIVGNGTVQVIYQDVVSYKGMSCPMSVSCEVASENLEYSETGNLVYFHVLYEDGTADILTLCGTSTTSGKVERPFNADSAKAINFVTIYVHNRFTGGTVTVSNIMLNEGTTALPYTPYIKPEEVKVTRCGKNLFDIGTIEDYIDPTSGLRMSNGSLSATVLTQNSRYFVNTKNRYLSGEYAISYESSDSKRVLLRLYDENGNIMTTCPNLKSAGFTFNSYYSGFYRDFTDGVVNIPQEVAYWNLGFVLLATETAPAGTTVEISNIQVELGSTATAYEPYNGQTLAPDADGTVEGMTSVSPYMNIFSDTEGVNIEATYNKSYGMQTEYDRFWDTFQNYGNRDRYHYAFALGMWNDDIFMPKYNVTPKYANFMFAYNNNEATGTNSKTYIFDLAACFEKAGTKLDTSNATELQQCFYMGYGFRHIPAVSFESCKELNATFYGCKNLVTIDKIILKADGTNTFTANSWDLPFKMCNSLKNIVIEGVIGQTVSFQDCPLTKASITNIINTLSTTVTGQTLTLKLSAVNTAFETSSGAADGSTSAEFAALVATKTNWTITMV